jgi:hypothetical protein
MHKCKIHAPVSFVTNQQPAIVAQPGDGPLDDPAASVATQCATILRRAFAPTAAVWANQLDALITQASAQRITVGRLIINQPFRLFVTVFSSKRIHQSYFNLAAQQAVDFRFRRRGNVNSQRKTLAVCHHHKLCTDFSPPLPAFGLADAEAPFLAGMKAPSPKVSSQISLPFSSSSERKARQRSSQISSSSQRLSRRQQVLGLGQCSGIGSHCAPDLSTQRMPSRHSRSERQGRPPLGFLGSSGRWGLIPFHIWSVTNCFFRAIGYSPPAHIYSTNKTEKLAKSVPNGKLFSTRPSLEY